MTSIMTDIGYCKTLDFINDLDKAGRLGPYLAPVVSTTNSLRCGAIVAGLLKTVVGKLHVYCQHWIYDAWLKISGTC